MAQLIPVCCKPVIAGDRFRVGLTYQMQLAPMYNPVYDGLTVNFEAFFVPNRILDPKWRSFWTGYNEYDQMTPVEIAPLTLTASVQVTDFDYEFDGLIGNGVGKSSLLDFLGVRFDSYEKNGMPVNNSAPTENRGYGDIKVNAFPILGYHRIYDDWYRNERTQKAVLYDYYNDETYRDVRDLAFSVVSTPTQHYIPELLRFNARNYAKDRFTTALPEPIIGGDVRIPVGDGAGLVAGAIGTDSLIQNARRTSLTDSTQVVNINAANGDRNVTLNALALGTIQQLKFAFKEYEFRMKDTYNGNRYVESMESHYGVRVPDSTLQRSLYLGSARDYVNFGEVYQTSAGNGENLESGALGDFAGRGGSNGSHYLFDETFYEPGHFFVIFSIAPKARYFQGVQRHMVRYERDDYFSPEYQNIGDDFIQNQEIFNSFVAYNQASENEKVFGFQTRWYDLKSSYDELHGDFADVVRDFSSGEITPGPMMSWTFTRIYKELPTISDLFSKVTIINRPFIETDARNDNYFVDIAFQIDALRPILTTESF